MPTRYLAGHLTPRPVAWPHRHTRYDLPDGLFLCACYCCIITTGTAAYGYTAHTVHLHAHHGQRHYHAGRVGSVAGCWILPGVPVPTVRFSSANAMYLDYTFKRLAGRAARCITDTTAFRRRSTGWTVNTPAPAGLPYNIRILCCL